MDGKLMKLKTIIAIALFPFALFGATTNQLDNILCKGSFQFTAGAPGAGKVLTSNAAGFGSWLAAGAGVQTNAVNVWTTNQFFSVISVGTNIDLGAMISVAPTANEGSYTLKSISSSANNFLFLDNNAGDEFFINVSTSGVVLQSSQAGDFMDLLGPASKGVLITGTSVQLEMNNIFGTDASSTMTANAPTLAIPNNLNIGSGVWNMNNATGVASNNGGIVSAANIQGLTLNSLAPATFVTNISSSSLTITAQGTHTINIEGASTGTTITNLTTTVPWLTWTGQGTKVMNLATNSIPVPIANGGTGTNSAAGARFTLGAAQSGTNSDITSMTVLSTINGPLTITNALTVLGPVSSIDSGTNTAFFVIVNGVSGNIAGVTVTNVLADFPSMLAGTSSELVFPISGVTTGMVCVVGLPPNQTNNFVVDCLASSNGFTALRCHNLSQLTTIDPPSLPYRISVTVTPTK